jgi:hypothetical protein
MICGGEWLNGIIWQKVNNHHKFLTASLLCWPCHRRQLRRMQPLRANHRLLRLPQKMPKIYHLNS